MKKISDETIEKIKKEKGAAYLGTIAFEDKEGTPHAREFLFRAPTIGDLEVYQKGVQKSPAVAQENLLRAVIVEPAAAEVIAELRDYPTPVATFIENELSPFFGANARTSSRRV